MAESTTENKSLSSTTGAVGQNITRGYSTSIFKGEVNAKFVCTECKQILRNPVQTVCGHRFCKECLDQALRSTESEDLTCPGCIQDGDVSAEDSILKIGQGFLDNAIRRELGALSVSCCDEGCDWSGSFKDYEALHCDVCEYRPVLCSICNEQIIHKEVSAADLADHLRDRFVQHLEQVHERLSLVERAIGIEHPGPARAQGGGGTGTGVIDKNILTKLSDQEKLLCRLDEKMRKTVDAYSTLGGGWKDGEGGKRGGTLGGRVGEVKDDAWRGVVKEIRDKEMVFEGVLTVLNREVEKLCFQTDASERTQRSDRELMDTFDSKVKSLERQLALKEANIADLELRMTSMEQTSYDGTLTWRITEFSRRRQEAVSGRTPSIYSPSFYTSKTGYRMCARLYLNGDGMGRGTHVSLFFVIQRGNYDALLKWPFRQKVTMMFIDQSNREHVLDSFRPDPTSSSFKRPTSEMNIASGCPLFLPLSTLDNQSYSYVRDNQAFLRITVSTEEVQA